ncbi:hypothetical protein B0H19DRAFT_1271013 [Mycena capillaripes]|nr:hypothetical protein B0H19DRAFT_1271013 [Mycena capillaripes]
MPPSRLNALFDTPSSPLASPSSGRAGRTTTPAGSPSSSGAPSRTPTYSGRRSGAQSSPYASPRVGRRTRRDDMLGDFTQFGALQGKKLKLKPEGNMKLEEFSKTADSKSEVAMYAQLIKIIENQALMVPAATGFVIPKKFEGKVTIHSIRTILDPALSAYVKKAGADSPSGILKNAILAHTPHWGITTKQTQDKNVWDPIASRCRHRLTDARYNILESLWTVTKDENGETVMTDRADPLDIIQLCEALTDLVPDAGVKVSLPMLGRVAILRQVLVDVHGGQKLWEKVEEQLADLRNRYADDENPEVKISKSVARVLKNDRRSYGNPDISIFN